MSLSLGSGKTLRVDFRRDPKEDILTKVGGCKDETAPRAECELRWPASPGWCQWSEGGGVWARPEGGCAVTGN